MFGKQAKKENIDLRNLLAETKEALAGSLEVARMAMDALAGVTPLTADAAEKLSKECPQWKIDIRVHEGEMTKHFTRNISDLSPTLYGDADTYKSLADPEYFDVNIANIFGAYSGSGEWFGKADGGFNGGEITVSVPVDTVGLTVLDARKIQEAEAYFQSMYAEQPVPA